MIDTFISGLDVPPMLLQPLEWKRLHTLVIGVKLYYRTPIEDVTDLLMGFHSPVLKDVTVQFPIIDKNFVYDSHRPDAEYVDEFLKFEVALSKFPRHRLYFLGSSEVHARKLFWMQELGKLFPTLRAGNRLVVDCETSERFGHSSSIV